MSVTSTELELGNEWSDVPAAQARVFIAAGMSWHEVNEWRIESTPAFLSSKSILAWRRTGLGPERARFWRALNIGLPPIAPRVAARYHARGWEVLDEGFYRRPSPIIAFLLQASACGDWEDWVRVKTIPEVVMVADDCRLKPADLTALLSVTKDPAVLRLAIKAGYGVAELRGMNLADPDVLASLAVAAQLNADADN